MLINAEKISAILHEVKHRLKYRKTYSKDFPRECCSQDAKFGVSAHKRLISWHVEYPIIILNEEWYDRVTVSAECRRSIGVRYLFLKWLYSQLSKAELWLFWRLPELTQDPLIFSCLLARNRGFSNCIIRKAAEIKKVPFDWWKPTSLMEWSGFKNKIRLQISCSRSKAPQPHIPSYSGWKPHVNDRGSVNPVLRTDPYPQEPIFEMNISEIFLEICSLLEKNEKISFNINNLRIDL